MAASQIMSSGYNCSSVINPIAIFRRARSLVESNYGRDDGWHIELDGVTVGELTDPRGHDMFWDSYLTHAADDAQAAILANDEIWMECRFRFRNRKTGAYAPAAHCGGKAPFVRDGRVVMRGLYLIPLSRLEAILVKLLSLLRSRAK
ncbi:MAG TPA: hypothetical protein VHV55_16755 [Pirellulales bacterium]|jgi:hypothetical protein|nr:hypothetical protein [Pirellulales bacterium]